MKYNALKYSLKIWLTSVAIAPVLDLIISFLQGKIYYHTLQQQLSDSFFMYCVMVVFEIAFSFITWIIFLLSIQIIINYVSRQVVRTWIIFITGILLTLGTFTVVLSPREILRNTDGFASIIFATCFCIGAGTWFYKLKPVTAEVEI
jgi:hypothetical protein